MVRRFPSPQSEPASRKSRTTVPGARRGGSAAPARNRSRARGARSSAGPRRRRQFRVRNHRDALALLPRSHRRGRGFDTELVTGRAPAEHFHSFAHYFWRAREMWPDLYCQIHPGKAAALGIAGGERVRVETVHGAIEAVAWVNAGIRES
ncbi:MAG: hypothetical protein IT529_02925 [Burkholderiales bacterium]|nr:hypothetical protein [Burkholderiales bacterium]